MAVTAPQFVHLHLHSEYSLLDGANKIEKLVARVKELGMPAVAVTDHGNLHGAVQLYNAAKDAGVKPILGIEAYVAPDVDGTSDRNNKERTGVADGGFHLVLLAENNTGWQHLLKLSSDAYINGFYFKPRMDKTTLKQWSKGLIAINGHLGSSIAYWLVKYHHTGDKAFYERAKQEAIWHRDLFGVNDAGEPCFYLEMQRHEEKLQDSINPHIVTLARELDLPLVCDNDAHWLMEDDYDAHDSLCCISMGKIKSEENRLHYPRGLYVKSSDEMAALFGADYPEAIENTARIAQRCNVELDFKANHAPVVKLEAPAAMLTEPPAKYVAKSDEGRKVAVGSTEWFKAYCANFQLLPFDSLNDKAITADELKSRCDAALRQLSEAGAIWRYGTAGITDAIRARLERELKVLADKSISAYFLIVWDFCNEARRRGIPVNARGSGVGTMVGYVLGLSNACPVQYGLLFERFTDPDRSEYPDIDIDICQNGRQEIIEYVRQKYGHVAQIITFGTLKARAAVRDVGRVLDMPLPQVDKICKLIGDGLGVKLKTALQQEPDLKKLYEEDFLTQKVMDTAIRLEGLARHAGVHAAGVIVATQPLDNIVPLYKPPGTETIVTQWDGPTCEKVGLLKMDFLGLRTLSIIEKAKELIRNTLGPKAVRGIVNTGRAKQGKNPLAEDVDPLDLERLTFDDTLVFNLFQRGETSSVFQFESGGMRNLLMSMKPDRLEDLIAANALYRPGPMDLIPDYNDRKHNRAPVPRMHEIVDRFTAETYGIMVYQEQVMQIIHELGDIPLREAYSIIKAISKKKEKTINAARDTFVAGAQTKGLAAQGAQDLFDLILKFAGYGFNKSHSTGYAIVAYQTAYLKTYFPVHYMAAVLTFESVSTEKVVEYIDECRRVLRPAGQRGIDVQPPDINLSEVGFTVVYGPGEKQDSDHGHIRFGLNAVKGVGEKAILAIIAAREKDGDFKSLYDFCERVPMNAVNRSTIEALIKCGAFDSVHTTKQRAAMAAALDDAMQAGQRVAADRDSGQLSFFESFAATATQTETSSTRVALPSVTPWTDNEILQHEKGVLGFYLSSHPMDQHIDTLRRFSNVDIADIRKLEADAPVTVGGMLTRVRPTMVKNGRSAGQKMAMLTIEDKSGPIDAVVFSDSYAIAAPLLETDKIVFLKGKVDRRREEPSIVVDVVIPVEQAVAKLTQQVNIRLRTPRVASDHGPNYNGELKRLQDLLRQAAQSREENRAEVYFEVHENGTVARMRINGMRVGISHDLPQRIDQVLHEPGACTLRGPEKLMRNLSAELAYDEAGPRKQEQLRRSTATEEEFCDSIDRY
jgi:DNA polymerase-3 subunit alpha